MKKLRSTFLCALLLGGVFCLLAPGLAWAQTFPVILGIDDSVEGVVTPVGQAPYGFDPTSLLIQAGPESFDLHGEYATQDPHIINGQSISVNVNFLDADEPLVFGSPYIGDTLNIVFTGHLPAFPGDLNNLSVDLHFRSDSESNLPGVLNAVEVWEVPGFMVMDGLIVAGGGPNDFHLSIASVPEPSTFIMLGLGIVSLVGYRLRKRFA